MTTIVLGFCFLVAAFGAFPGSRVAIGLGYLFFCSILAGIHNQIQAQALITRRIAYLNARSLALLAWERVGGQDASESENDAWLRATKNAGDQLLEEDAANEKSGGMLKWLRVTAAVVWEIVSSLLTVGVAAALAG